MVWSSIMNYLWDDHKCIWYVRLLGRVESYVVYVRVGKTCD